MTGPGHRPVPWPRVIVVTGTDTGVGKTVVTAALATLLQDRLGRGTAVDKPTQTGIAGAEEADVEAVSRLSGVRVTSEGIRLGAAMAPVAAARRAGTTLPTRGDHLDRIARLADRHDHVLVEGAGGVLVELTDDGTTLADLAAGLRDRLGTQQVGTQQVGTQQVGVVVVCRSGLGTLNHTALTVEALHRRQVPLVGLVIGSWPADPDDVDASNRGRLADCGVPLLGAVPAGAGGMSGTRFRREAPGWFDPTALDDGPRRVSPRRVSVFPG